MHVCSCDSDPTCKKVTMATRAPTRIYDDVAAEKTKQDKVDLY
mgnify:CR=1 FL=1